MKGDNTCAQHRVNPQQVIVIVVIKSSGKDSDPGWQISKAQALFT